MSLKIFYHVSERNSNANLCSIHKKSVWWNRCLLGSHFVVDESEKCGDIPGTARGESENFSGSGD
jgi:hypothetical protein